MQEWRVGQNTELAYGHDGAIFRLNFLVQFFRSHLALLAGGVIGFDSINLFYINILYGLAIPLWLIGAVLVLIAA